MEKINLFRFKRPILKFSSFMTLTVALLLPVLAMRFTLDFYKRMAIETTYNTYSSVVEKYRINRRLSLNNVLTMLNQINDQLLQTSKRLQAQIDYLENYIKNYNDRMEPLLSLLKTLQKSDQNWIVLKEFIYDDSVRINLYELYDPSAARKLEQIEQVLMAFGYRVTKSNEYDATMQLLNKRISSVLMEGRK